LFNNVFKLNIDQIRDQIESQNQEEREIYGESISSKDILTALHANEDGDARLYINVHRDSLVYDHDLRQWFRWNNHYWEEDRLNDALARITDVVDVYEKELSRQSEKRLQAVKSGDAEKAKKYDKKIGTLLKRIGALQKLDRKRNVLTLAAAGDDSLGVISETWDTNPWVLGCSNGVIDLRTGNFRSGKPDDYIKTVVPTEWVKDAPASEWREFLSEIFDGDKELIGFVHRLFGYSIIGSTIEHILPILYGRGRNGKSTLIEVLSKVLGTITAPIQSEMLLKQKHSRSSDAPSPSIMTLKGKRMVWACEADEGRSFNISKIKWLVGGDTLVGRPLYGKRNISFSPTHTLFLLTNNKPHAPADAYAFWQRVFLIPFNLSFVDEPIAENERKRDPKLSEKLIAESSGILAWLVEGALIYQKEGLNPPDIVTTATKDYIKEEDILSHYEAARVMRTMSTDDKVRAQEFYDDYKRWCTDNNLTPMTGTAFGKKMAERYHKDSDRQGAYYEGVCLLPRAESDLDIEEF